MIEVWAREVDLRGSSYDRRRRKNWMLHHYGDGDTAPCTYCGEQLTYETLTTDRIVPGSQGGRYTRDNVVPACEFHNKSRQDTDFHGYREYVAEMVEAGQQPAFDYEAVPYQPPRAASLDLGKFAQSIAHEQYEKAAQQLYEWAQQNEAWLTPMLDALAQEWGGELQGLDFRIKQYEGIVDKLQRKHKTKPQLTADELVDTVVDALRYTMQFPEDVYTQAVQGTIEHLSMEHDFDFYEVANAWEKGDPYRGINSEVAMPNGFKFELQFHTAESWETKQYRTHELYNEFRDPNTSLERKQDLYLMMADIWEETGTPEGVMDIGEYKFYEFPLSAGRR